MSLLSLLAVVSVTASFIFMIAEIHKMKANLKLSIDLARSINSMV